MHREILYGCIVLGTLLTDLLIAMAASQLRDENANVLLLNDWFFLFCKYSQYYFHYKNKVAALSDKVLEVNGQILKPSKCIPNQVAGTIGKGNRRDLNIGNAAGNVNQFYMTDYSLHYFTLGLRNLR